MTKTMTNTTRATETTGAATSDGAAPPDRPRRRRVRRWPTRAGLALLAIVVALGAVVLYSARQTEADIRAFRDRVERIGVAEPAPVYDPVAAGAAHADLPAPVRRYFDYVFVEPGEPTAFVELTMAGEFRRPLTDGFNPTTAEQTIAVGTPSLMFSARTSLLPGLWARAYDFYADGTMEMRAEIMSTITVVDEGATPELNQTSLRRWLLESPLYPAALLPGGPVRWVPIDDTHARAIVAADGLEASLVATFGPDGSLVSFHAEHDGDLTTPYHGSGEHVLRGDYRLVDGMMIPHSFTISRAAGGETFPFWIGEIETISFHPVGR